MRELTWAELDKLCEMIETAVKAKCPIIFPEGIYPVLQVSAGPTFTIPRLAWIDESRNVYQAFMRIEFHSHREMLPGLYVVGTRTLDGRSSGDLSMIKKENRYRSII